jgi:hypothetical protein
MARISRSCVPHQRQVASPTREGEVTKVGHNMLEEEEVVKIKTRARGMIAPKAQVSQKTAEEGETIDEAQRG